MPDPVDWGLVLESPIFWGAVMTLIGVLALVNVPIVSPNNAPTEASEFPEITEADLIPYPTHDSGEAEYDPKVMPGVAQSKQG